MSVVGLAMIAAFGGGAAAAQTVTNATRPAYEQAYASAIKCFVANGHAMISREEAGDSVGASTYDAKARHSHDVARNAGRALGYSSARIEGDIGRIQDRELPLMVRDQSYFTRSVAECRAMGLM